jgi:hypothetical protein
MIGNFFTSLNTSIVYDGNNSTMCYYFVDQVCTSTDSLYAETFTPTSLNEKLPEEEFILFPNPCENYFIISGIQTNTIKIYDSNGSLIIDKKIQNNEPINTTDFQNGMYLIIMQNKKKKIIIKN